MNARERARGTRRPRGSAGTTPRAPRGGGRGRSSGDGGKKKGCGKTAALILFALISLPTVVAVVIR